MRNVRAILCACTKFAREGVVLITDTNMSEEFSGRLDSKLYFLHLSFSLSPINEDPNPITIVIMGFFI